MSVEVCDWESCVVRLWVQEQPPNAVLCVDRDRVEDRQQLALFAEHMYSGREWATVNTPVDDRGVGREFEMHLQQRADVALQSKTTRPIEQMLSIADRIGTRKGLLTAMARTSDVEENGALVEAVGPEERAHNVAARHAQQPRAHRRDLVALSRVVREDCSILGADGVGLAQLRANGVGLLDRRGRPPSPKSRLLVHAQRRVQAAVAARALKGLEHEFIRRDFPCRSFGRR